MYNYCCYNLKLQATVRGNLTRITSTVTSSLFQSFLAAFGRRKVNVYWRCGGLVLVNSIPYIQ